MTMWFTEFRKYLHRPSLRAFKRWGKLNPYEGEAALSIEVANFLTVLSLEGRLEAVWTKIANEGLQSVQMGALMKAMGKNPGVADFLIATNLGNIWIELKLPPKIGSKGQLKAPIMLPSQKMFADWCGKLSNQYYYVATSVTEVEKILVSHKGVLAK